ncbi:MAG TPA: hypothetical protein VN634_19355 [Candidatus Limnocylindrales bacterium]|nr:hypothetical protein [Candidatus Limnocylindrales bacterium]
MRNRTPSFFLLATSLFAFAVPAGAAAIGGCIPGVYLVREGSGTQSLWSFSTGGTIHSTSSAQGALHFGDGYGAWKQGRGQQVRSTFVDFSYNSSPIDGGFPPTSVARVDAVSTFSERCAEIHGTFELRFFDPASEDPLDPATDAGGTITDTFTGRRVSAE